MNPFFDTTPLNLPAIAADAYCLYLAVVLAATLRLHWQFLNFSPRVAYGPAPRILNRIPVPQLAPHSVLICQIVMIALLISAIFTTGLLNRVSLLGAFVGYFVVFAQLHHIETNRRKTYLIPLFLGIFLITPDVAGDWQSEAAYWPIWALKLCIVQIYVSAAMQKIRRSGFDWGAGHSFGRYLQWLQFFEDIPLARKIGPKSVALKAAAGVVLLMQATFWIILIVPKAGIAYLVFGIVFHIGTLVLMNINYIKYLTGAYLILLLDMLWSWNVLSELIP